MDSSQRHSRNMQVRVSECYTVGLKLTFPQLLLVQPQLECWAS